jgi:hypothetical protein
LKKKGWEVESRTSKSFNRHREYKLGPKGEPREASVRIMLTPAQAGRLIKCPLPDDLKDIVEQALKRRLEYGRWE